MRSDISKVLVTTPRIGSRWKNGEVRALRRERIDEDYDGPRRTSMKPSNAGWERKQLNEYLNPLYRFLERRVGERWDNVYSEICASNSRGSAVGEHIYQHLFDYVRVKTTDVSSWFNPDFFVDGDGILRRSAPRERWKPAPLPGTWRATDDETVWYVRRDGDGCWFEWRLVEDPDDTLFSLRGTPKGFESGGLPRKPGHIGRLRTLSKKEKKALA
jgi:hypothetical protein